MSDADPHKNRLDELRIDRDSEERGGASIWIWMVVVLLVLVAGFFVWRHIANPQLPEVTIRIVQETGGGDSTDGTVLNASGYVTARRKATVSSKTTGKIVDVLIEEGMEVAKDQVLAQLDTSNVDANLGLAQAQLEAARTVLGETQALLGQAEQDFKRISDLADQKIASASDRDAAEAQALSLRARLLRQEQEIVVAQRSVDLWTQEKTDRTIKAPFAGVVVAKNAQPGEMISPVSAGGGFTRTGIGTIVDMSSLEIEVDVNESYINRVQPGQTVSATLDSYPDWKIPCKVIAIIPTADRQKATVRVRIGFDQLDPRILPDMGVKVAFRDAEPNEPQTSTPSITVPASAIQPDLNQSIVLVVRNNIVERRAVKTGPTRNGEVPILSGLTAGERIITQGPPGLKDGDRVRPAKP